MTEEQALARIAELEQRVLKLEAEKTEIVRRAIHTICLCDKHTDISFEDFVARHHCPLCCHAEAQAREKDKSSQV